MLDLFPIFAYTQYMSTYLLSFLMSLFSKKCASSLQRCQTRTPGAMLFVLFQQHVLRWSLRTDQRQLANGLELPGRCYGSSVQG
jgi:hypothetical protein